MNNENAMRHYNEDIEIWLNGHQLGTGTVVIEAQGDTEEFTYGGLTHQVTQSFRRKAMIHFEEDSPYTLSGDWILKSRTDEGELEHKFDSRDEAQSVFKALAEMKSPGSYELVCRPKTEDVLVSRLDHQPAAERGPKAAPAQFLLSDFEGDVWEAIDGRWVYGDSESERREKALSGNAYNRLPKAYGPYDLAEGQE